jgi:hypothetical protein
LKRNKRVREKRPKPNTLPHPKLNPNHGEEKKKNAKKYDL